MPDLEADDLKAALLYASRKLAKTDTPPPTDEEVNAMLDERLAQKYL